MKYESQKVAYYYILAALVLFALQVTFGLVAGFIYVSPNFLSETLPFNIVRMVHTSSLIVWLLGRLISLPPLYAIYSELNRHGISRTVHRQSYRTAV